MPTERKVQQVADLEERLNRTVMAIGLDYRRLSVGQMRALRVALREQEPSMELRVIKNTLLKRAAENAGKPGVFELANQATALVLGYEEEIAPPKALKKYLRESRLEIPIHGGYLDGEVLTAAQVDDLASVPSRLELMARLAGGINGPVGGIAGGLHALLRELAAIIDARAEQLAADAPAEDAAPAQDDAGAEPPADSTSDDTADGGEDGAPVDRAAPDGTVPDSATPSGAAPDNDATGAGDSDNTPTPTESSDE